MTTEALAIPALVDAEILAGHLEYTLAQLLEHAELSEAQHFRLRDAARLATECAQLVQQASGVQP
jgi:hypothetical protein